MTVNRIVDVESIPAQKIPALPMGSNNIYQAGMAKSTQEAALHNKLVGGTKRYKKRKNLRHKGGAAAILAPVAPSHSTGGTQNNYNKLAQLGMNVQNAGVYDKTTTQSQVAGLSTEQNKIYYGKGGSPIEWGCLSGGNTSKRCKSKRRKKSYRCKRKHKKNCKTCKTCKTCKHRKTCKHMKIPRN